MIAPDNQGSRACPTYPTFCGLCRKLSRRVCRNQRANRLRNPPRADVALAEETPGQRTAFQVRSVGRIAAKEFNDRLRSGWVLACFLLWLGAVGLTSCYGLVQIGRIGVQGYERTVISLLNLVQYLVPLLGLLIGQDLIVSEREDRTLCLVLASGVSRVHLLAGKLVGGCLSLSFPLLLGFLLAGGAIGLAAKDAAIAPFLRLAASGLTLGLVFVGIGLAISTLCRTRLQALVLALLAWGIAVFVFDLVALSVVLAAKAPGAAQEIEVVCDATHINAAADLHSAFDGPTQNERAAVPTAANSGLDWLFLNPIDLFRAINLPKQLNLALPWWAGGLSCGLWISLCLGASIWKFRRLDL